VHDVEERSLAGYGRRLGVLIDAVRRMVVSVAGQAAGVRSRSKVGEARCWRR
jgi:hypothetical protein